MSCYTCKFCIFERISAWRTHVCLFGASYGISLWSHSWQLKTLAWERNIFSNILTFVFDPPHVPTRLSRYFLIELCCNVDLFGSSQLVVAECVCQWQCKLSIAILAQTFGTPSKVIPLVIADVLPSAYHLSASKKAKSGISPVLRTWLMTSMSHWTKQRPPGVQPECCVRWELYRYCPVLCMVYFGVCNMISEAVWLWISPR